SRGEVAGGVLATEGVDGQGAVMGGVDDGVTAALGVAAPEPAFVVIGARGGGGAVILPNADFEIGAQGNGERGDQECERRSDEARHVSNDSEGGGLEACPTARVAEGWNARTRSGRRSGRFAAASRCRGSGRAT